MCQYAVADQHAMGRGSDLCSQSEISNMDDTAVIRTIQRQQAGF